MGGPNKLLLPWKDSTVLGCVLGALRSAGVEATVVTGRDADLVSELAAGFRTCYNGRYTEGIGSSIAAGAAQIQDAGGIMVVLADMPDLDSSVVSRLVDAFEEAPEGAIVAPIYESEPNRLGHPVIFSIHQRPALCMLSGEEGARKVVEANRDKVITVPVPGRLDDLDEPF
jgi:molybdenum cofactor cytidylyltransferase